MSLYPLLNLLDHCSSENEITHLSLSGGKYYIGDSEINDFYRLYSDNLFNKLLNYVEKPKENSPLIIDIDIDQTSQFRKYTLNDIKYIIKTFTKYIDKFYNVDNYDTVILEKQKPTKKSNNFKDGIHIIYPHIAVSKKMRLAITDLVIKDINKGNSLKHLLNGANSSEKIIDKIVNHNGMMIYGSRKPNQLSYHITHILNKLLEDCSNDYINNTEFDFVKLLSLRKFNSESKLTEEGKIYKNNGTVKIIEKNIKKSNIIKQKDNIQLAKDLVDLLDPNRSDNYHMWLHVGFALKNTDNKLYDTWLDFSKKCPSKYDERVCRKVWDNSKKGVGLLTIDSLHYWAELDNKDLYDKYINT